MDAFDSAHVQVTTFSACLLKTYFNMNQNVNILKTEWNVNREKAQNLKKGIKNYPAELLTLKNKLEAELNSRLGHRAEVIVLADVLEITQGQEKWRGVVEGYLSTQKFYLLTAPENFKSTLNIFDEIKHEFKHSFGLVDIEKLRQNERLSCAENSLAVKVETKNPLARSYVDYLLGRVVCCANAQELRDHKIAVTADGMLYQGYVARPIAKSKMNDCFIGQKAIKKRLEMQQQRQTKIKNGLEQINPFMLELEKLSQHDMLFNERFAKTEVRELSEKYKKGLHLSAKIQDMEDKLDSLDLTWLMELTERIEKLKSDVELLEKEKGQCEKEETRQEDKQESLTEQYLPNLQSEQERLEQEISQQFSEDYSKKVGILHYEQELKRLKHASVVAKNFGDSVPQSENAFEQAKETLFVLRSNYVRVFQPCSYNIEAVDNDEFEAEKKQLEESDLPKYREKIKQAKNSAMEQFQNDFLAKLKAGIDQVEEQVKELNHALSKTQFGTDSYRFKVDKNPDYADYYDMITDKKLMEDEGGLFAIPFQNKYGPLIEDLFGRITASDDEQLNARKQSELQQNIKRYTDFRTYLKFDLETTDADGNKQLLSKTLNTKSGGETQTPFYIAVLASFAQLYRVGDLSSMGNTLRLVVLDEAFNKMDSDRIIESVRLLRKMHLQAIVCTPPDKLPDIMPEADSTLLVTKKNYNMNVMSYSKGVKDNWNEKLY